MSNMRTTFYVSKNPAKFCLDPRTPSEFTMSTDVQTDRRKFKNAHFDFFGLMITILSLLTYLVYHEE